MARPLRIEYEGAVYHILSRGNRADYIFSEDKDKEYFIETLQKTVEKYKVNLYAYCVMGNHYHMLMSAPYGELTKIMHYIGSTYGSYMRRSKGWIGHVFAGRYKSLCVEKEGYLLELSRYIHLNPVRAGIVKKPEEYQWCSYKYYIGKIKNPEWLNTGWLLEEYGKTLKTSQRKYKEFVEAGIENPPPYPAKSIVGQAILGSKEFIKKIIKGMKKDRGFEEITAKRIYSGRIDLEALHNAVCKYYKVTGLTKEKERISKVARHGREMFIYLAKKETSTLNREIAEKIGDISSSGITHQYKRTLKRQGEDKKLSRQWKRDAEEIISQIKG